MRLHSAFLQSCLGGTAYDYRTDIIIDAKGSGKLQDFSEIAQEIV